MQMRSNCGGFAYRLVDMTRFTRNSSHRLPPVRRMLSSSSSSSSSFTGRPVEYNAPKQLKEDHSYCVNLVRERDREGYLCGLLMPAPSQQAYFALRAFNVELASIKDSHNLRRSSGQLMAQDPNRGGMLHDTPTTLALQMRMQWWRDAIDKIYGGDSTLSTTAKYKETAAPIDPALLNLSVSCWYNPVVRSLDIANRDHDFTKRFLERLIDARETDLEINQYSTVKEVKTYAEETVSSLLYLTLESTGVRDDEADEAAFHAGIGIGLTTALRATPFRLRHGELPLPAELFRTAFPYDELVRWNENDDFTISESDAQIFENAVRQMAQNAAAHFGEAGELQSKVPRKGRTALMPVVPSLHFLSKLDKADYNLFDPSLNDQANRLPLLLLMGRTWLSGVF